VVKFHCLQLQVVGLRLGWQHALKKHHHTTPHAKKLKSNRPTSHSIEMTLPRRRHLVLLAGLLVLVVVAATATASTDSSSTTAVAVDFVRRSCRSTEYPRVCETTLVPCAASVGRSPRRLARAALVVGADRARNCSAYIHGSRSGSGGAMKDCAELARDAEDRLRQSAAEMERMGRAGTPRFAWSLSNVQTWASAALTDTSTCLDSLAQHKDRGRGGKGSDGDDAVRVKRRVVAVAQATSNALALVNRLQPATHRQRLLL